MLHRRMPMWWDHSSRRIAHKHNMEALAGVLMQGFHVHTWIQRLPGDTGCLDIERAYTRLGAGHMALLPEGCSVDGRLPHTCQECSTRVAPRRKGALTKFCRQTPQCVTLSVL